jgi:alpha-2-macroglobulin
MWNCVTVVLVLFVTLLGGCNNGFEGDESQGRSEESAALSSKKNPTQNTIHFQIAPFNLFPETPVDGFEVRFSERIIEGRRARGRALQSATLNPPLSGDFSWRSDSSLQFLPNRPLPASSIFTIALGEIDALSRLPFSEKTIQVRTPDPYLKLFDCQLQTVSKEPEIKRFAADLYVNYPLHGYYEAPYRDRQIIHEQSKRYFSLSQRSGSESRNMPLSTFIESEGMVISISGTDLLRPDKEGEYLLKVDPGLVVEGGKALSGTECKVPYAPTDWRVEASAIITESEQKPKQGSVDAVFAASNSSRATLSVSFSTLSSDREELLHSLPVSTLISKGITLSPPVEGEWRVESSSSIVFTPKTPWLPKGVYSVHVDKEVVPSIDLIMQDRSVQAPPLVATFAGTDSGLVEEDRSKRMVSASVSFSHPVTTDYVEKLVSLSVEEVGRKGSKRAHAVSVKQGATSTEFYLKSTPLSLLDYPQVLKFTINGVISSTVGGAPSELAIVTTYTLPSRLDIFSVREVDSSVVVAPTAELRRVVSLEASEDVDEGALSRHLKILLLPDCSSMKKKESWCPSSSMFSNGLEVTELVEKASELIAPTFMSRSDGEGDQTFSYSYSAPGRRQILVEVKEGLQSKLGFPLAKPYREVLYLREYPKRVSIMAQGSLLSLSGQKRVGIFSQNVKKIKYRLARVNASELHHLLYFTSGAFQNPRMKGGVSYDDLSEQHEFVEEVNGIEVGKPYYTSVDLGRFMKAEGIPPRGLFYLEVKHVPDEKSLAPKPTPTLQPQGECLNQVDDGVECVTESDLSDDSSEEETSTDDSSSEGSLTDARLVVLTDLGMVVKRDLEGGERVYVSSFRKGEPLAGARVRLIARNGSTLFSEISNAQGEVVFPKVDSFTREKEPTLYVAEKDGDLTYLSYQERDRTLSFSRFNVGGVYNHEGPNALSALLFTDRGIYRPGESVSFAAAVRQRDLKPLSTEMPLELQIKDPRGESLVKDKILFSRRGLSEYRYDSSQEMMTGTYTASLVIPSTKKFPEREISSVTFRLEEFEPDRLTISASLGDKNAPEFLPLSQLRGKVTLRNLFGVAAAGNRVKAKFFASPWDGSLPQFPGYTFGTEIAYSDRQNYTHDLGELVTNDDGTVDFPVSLAEVNGAVLDAALTVEGFEKESGRSVATTIHRLTTDLSLLLGIHSEDSLSYVDKGAPRSIDLRAVNLKGEAVSSGKIIVQIKKREYRNVLVKQSNGVYKYESAEKLMPVSSSVIECPPDGMKVSLATNVSGNYIVSFHNESQVPLNKISYQVAGEANEEIRINRDARLELALGNEKVVPGAEVSLSIKAPYSGYGLISVERDRVLSTQWFKSDTSSSVQKVSVPKDLIGNAYVTVLFVRSWSSKEVYLEPLSYASIPLPIDEHEYLAPPVVRLPSVMKPGASLPISYSVGEPGTLLVYGVDEGILQFGKYQPPNVLKSLLPKRALEVSTRTALDQIMPDLALLQNYISSGGDEDVDLSKYQNPFKKKRRPPVALWSGLKDVSKGEGTLSFDIPDYFDGALKIFALFVGERKIGFSTARNEVRGDLVIKPTLPSFASPGDRIEMPVEVTATGTDPFEGSLTVKGDLITQKENVEVPLRLDPGRGSVHKVYLTIGEELGESSIAFRAHGEKGERIITETLAVRPANPLTRSVRYGLFDPEKPGDLPERREDSLRSMFPYQRFAQGYISHSPGLFIDALNQFMEGYPYGCSEQIISKGFLSLLLSELSNEPVKKEALLKKVKATVKTITSRLNADGSVAYWQRGETGNQFVSMYTTHFLVEVIKRGIDVPQWVINAVRLKATSLSRENAFTIDHLFPQAYALYLRARLGEVVTSDLASMISRLNEVENVMWRGSALSTLIGATYLQMKMQKESEPFMKPFQNVDFSSLPHPYNLPALNVGLIEYLKGIHVGTPMSKDMIFSLLNKLYSESPDSLTVASVALGLAGSSQSEWPTEDLRLVLDDKDSLPLEGNAIKTAAIPELGKSLIFRGENKLQFFFSLVQSGFNRDASKEPERMKGVSVVREVSDKDGKPVEKYILGESYRATVRIATEKAIDDFAVQDLLPSGFEIDIDSLQSRRSVGGESNQWNCEKVDIRDDRILLFGDLGSGSVAFSYLVKPTVRGEFTWPGTYGEAMYDTRKYSWDRAMRVTVE